MKALSLFQDGSRVSGRRLKAGGWTLDIFSAKCSGLLDLNVFQYI